MAIGRVPGAALLNELDRQGLDLYFTTSSQTLAYLDFTNFRLGVNTATPQQALEVVGNAQISSGSFFTNQDLNYDIGKPSLRWRNIYAGQLTGTLQTGAQPNITSIGTLSGLNFTGNLNANDVGASILPSAMNTGSLGALDKYWGQVYANVVNTNYIYAQLLTSYQPYITSLANVTAIGLTVSNLTVTNTTAIAGNLSLIGIYGQEVYDNNHRVLTNVSVITATGTDVSGSGTYNALALSLSTTGVTPGTYGAGDNEILDKIPVISIDSKGRITAASNVSLNQIANIAFANTTISSTANVTIRSGTNSNIFLTTGGTGTVQLSGNLAVGIPRGNTATRPSTAISGYLRFNTELDGLEWYNGTAWSSTADRASITSQSITPDGVSTNYFLAANATTEGTIVSINGTLQAPGNAYTIAGNVITFAQAPLSTDAVEIRRLDINVVSVESLTYGSSNIRMTVGTATVNANLVPYSNLTYNIGSTSSVWNTIYAGNLSLLTPLPITSGGTGATARADALTNLLPDATGVTPGYVLATSGPGSFYWAAGGTGAGGGLSGSPIISTRILTTATAGQTVFTSPTYTIGTGQLRVFINGVRQFDTAYTETSSTSLTLSAGVRAGTQVLAEVDGYNNTNIVTANTSASSNITVDSYSISTTRTVKYVFQVGDYGYTPNKVMVGELLVFHNNNGASTIPYIVDYAGGNNTGDLGVWSVAYSGGNVVLNFKPNYTPTNLNIKINKQSILNP
jgi:hypothetical protein